MSSSAACFILFAPSEAISFHGPVITRTSHRVPRLLQTNKTKHCLSFLIFSSVHHFSECCDYLNVCVAHFSFHIFFWDALLFIIRWLCNPCQPLSVFVSAIEPNRKNWFAKRFANKQVSVGSTTLFGSAFSRWILSSLLSADRMYRSHIIFIYFALFCFHQRRLHLCFPCSSAAYYTRTSTKQQKPFPLWPRNGY